MIITIGGDTAEGMFTKSTEVLKTDENRWSRGPNLPIGVRSAACVAIPCQYRTKYASLLIGGYTPDEKFSPNIYALDINLTAWCLIGKLKTGRRNHIALLCS